MVYRYYCLFRPPDLGAVPRGFWNVESFGERRECREADCQAWGYVEYKHELTRAEIVDYELLYGGKFPG